MSATGVGPSGLVGMVSAFITNELLKLCECYFQYSLARVSSLLVLNSDNSKRRILPEDNNARLFFSLRVHTTAKRQNNFNEPVV